MSKYKIDGDDYEVKMADSRTVVVTMNGEEIHRRADGQTVVAKSVMVNYVGNVLRARIRDEERKAKEAEERGSDLERLLEKLEERWRDSLYDWRTDE